MRLVVTVAAATCLGNLSFRCYSTGNFKILTGSIFRSYVLNFALDVSFAANFGNREVTSLNIRDYFLCWCPFCVVVISVYYQYLYVTQWRSQDLEVGGAQRVWGNGSPPAGYRSRAAGGSSGSEASRKLIAYYGYLAAKPCIFLCI